jgi:hypothetical protein
VSDTITELATAEAIGRAKFHRVKQAVRAAILAGGARNADAADDVAMDFVTTFLNTGSIAAYGAVRSLAGPRIALLMIELRDAATTGRTGR